MASSSNWLVRLTSALGPPSSVRVLGDGAFRLDVAGRSYMAKTGPGVVDEAEGLASLASVPGGPPVPHVVVVEDDLMVCTWVDQSPRSPTHDEELGRALAFLHSAPADGWGGGSSWIGACPVDPEAKTGAVDFYGSRLLALAQRCGLSSEVARVVDRLDALIAPDPPAMLHGDLWWGNVLWGSDGRAWVIDPSVHGGHPEEDLAMLGLFGEVPDRLRRAYAEVRPMTPGWEERTELFQLYPLLVHAVLFGGEYCWRAASVAARFG